jgi:hypothetical protein
MITEEESRLSNCKGVKLVGELQKECMEVALWRSTTREESESREGRGGICVPLNNKDWPIRTRVRALIG